MNSAERVLMMNLKLMNIIKDDDNMIWTSPYRDIIFEINRMENTMSEYFQEYWGKYIISITVKNNLGTTITEIRFSEIDAVRILDAMTFFLTEGSYGYGDSMLIELNTSNSNLNYPYFNFEVVNYTPDSYIEDDMLEERNIKFDVKINSPFYRKNQVLCTIFMNHNELNELIFDIYLISLSNSSIPEEKINEISDDLYYPFENY